LEARDAFQCPFKDPRNDLSQVDYLAEPYHGADFPVPFRSGNAPKLIYLAQRKDVPGKIGNTFSFGPGNSNTSGIRKGVGETIP
jgi:hypothetical protein